MDVILEKNGNQVDRIKDLNDPSAPLSLTWNANHTINLIKIQIINHRILFIVSSRVGWVIIGDPGSEKMVGGMSMFSTRSRQVVSQQCNGEDETWCWRIGKSVKVKMTVWSQVREGIGSYDTIVSWSSHCGTGRGRLPPWKRATVRGGWLVATEGCAKSSLWSSPESVVNNMPWDRWRRWTAAWEGQEGHKPGRLGVTYAQL